MAKKKVKPHVRAYNLSVKRTELSAQANQPPPEYYDKPPRIRLALWCKYDIEEIEEVIEGKKKFPELEKILGIWTQDA